MSGPDPAPAPTLAEGQEKIILAINAGSSSVKISAYAARRGREPRQIAEAQVSGLTAPPARLTYTRGGKGAGVRVRDGEELPPSDSDRGAVTSQDEAFSLLLAVFVDDPDLPEIGSAADIAIACHRVVHGGDYAHAVTITPDALHRLERLTDLAPLHNATSLRIIRACTAALPASAHNVAHFDSQFHASIPPHICTYPLDPEIARNNQLRKYGFHGISYAFLVRAVSRFLGKPADALNLIALHLGSGASACAIRGGRSWDTSMGLTPLAGLPGATRSGSVDPSLVFHYASDVGRLSPASTRELHISVAEEILNKQSGWRALTGTTDFGHIAAARASDPACSLAFDLFANRVCGYVGSYYVALGGEVDALVFAGGIGEHSAALRAAVAGQAACLGFALDAARNEAGPAAGDAVTDVGAEGARHRTLVCQTDEQYEMAFGCAGNSELWA
ncbi:acetate kinase [Durotheca rogersii]|uniref:acetate kinase n=1 Tax=Durotheca rogersii TaxID=419775 RepID=UPI00221FEF5B|nr:acetate kinase [Durotheca rogersii]KAI5862698.1 acetate kinase [Durotheca rogersii]